MIGEDKCLDFILVYGIGIWYNDVMEFKVFYLLGLREVLFFSLKGIYGYILGVVGLVEIVILIVVL